MTLIAPIYLPYEVLIDCCMPTCTCTHAKLSRTSFFLGQILNPKTSFFLGRREYMESKGDPIFTELSTVCGRQRVKELMGFRQDWNKEIITQFYATGHFGYIESERSMTWMTIGNRHSIRFSRS
jgi:hypothetical protein